MVPLVPELRKILENRIPDAREAAEQAARAILDALAVMNKEPYPSMTPDQRRLRNALRAKARQLGGGFQSDGYEPLIEELAYQQWHRMIFARFLAENNLLMHPSGVPVTLQECADLATDEGEADAWAVASKYTSLMLPEIFRPEDPETKVRLTLEGQQKLETILNALPPATFLADDALGWMYQFWQSRKKDEINKSEKKIGGADIAPVTQLFTEDYMVRFLLENTLGAWWAARHPNSLLINDWEYLRFNEDGKPAAGSYPDWPEKAAEVTVMDPCCGSGHFLVAAFDMLRKMRMEEEGLDGNHAGDSVLQENIFGMEIDPRCTQIAIFALSLLAWKRDEFHPLPGSNIVCTGLPVKGQLTEWTVLAGKDEGLKRVLTHLYQVFSDAPNLGSLIDPGRGVEGPLFDIDYTRFQPALEKIYHSLNYSENQTSLLYGETALDALRASNILSRKYTIVSTNVPFLGNGKQEEILAHFLRRCYYDSRFDLYSTFIERSLQFVKPNGTIAIISPQTWLFLKSYTNFRRKILHNSSLVSVTNLGPKGFQTPMWDFGVSLFIITKAIPAHGFSFWGLDVSKKKTPGEKAYEMKQATGVLLDQSSQLKNPDYRISLEKIDTSLPLLSEFADSYWGIGSGDTERFVKCFWEVCPLTREWEYLQGTFSKTKPYDGREQIIFWQLGKGQLYELAEELKDRLKNIWQRGSQGWGKHGIVISQMGGLGAALYTGEIFQNGVASIIPKNPDHIRAIWAYCSSPSYSIEVRKVDQKIAVTNATLVKVPFDFEFWQKEAEKHGPLPVPFSNDPTQWLFEGYPIGTTDPLQVALARLLGYRWPEQKTDLLIPFVDEDGILCLLSIFGEPPAADRLRSFLSEVNRQDWSPARQAELLEQAGSPGKTMEDWLRDDFFPQHCKLFQNRPFIWHIWDGRKDGFSALVNYHKLTKANLERLIFTYLGDWINFQRGRRDHGEPGADGRLVAAIQLQEKLKLILQGEPPYDIYVRWKPLHEQPMGWDPDLNDGVRLNIRPFVTAGVLRSKFTINWNKDRGKNPDGSERLNDLHYTIAEKKEARRIAGK